MGLLKKIFNPAAKVLDKIIPNEIKPALPYLAAFAPIFAPAGMQGIIGSTMGRRALTSGLLNIGAQLAQEGNEGDINLLSAGLGALSGAMTTPQGVDFSMSAPGEGPMITKGAAGIFKDKAAAAGTDTLKGKGLEFLAKGSDVLAKGAADPFSTAGLKAATLPAATATGDLMQAEARQLEKQAAIDAALAEAEALADAGLRGDAIRNAMRAYGFFTDDEIESTVSSAGYKAGGRVGLMMGGPTANQGLNALLGSEMLRRESMDDAEERPFKFDAQQFMIDQYNEEGIQPEIIGEGFDGQSFVIRTPNGGSMIISLEDFTANFGEPPMKAKGIERDALDQPYRYKAGGRVGFRFGGIDKAIEGVSEEIQEEGKEGIMMAAKEDPLLVEEYNKYVFDLLEQRPDAKPMSFADFKRMIKSGMKDGGIMKAKRGLVNEPGGYAGEMAGPPRNKIEGFGKKMVDEFLQGNLPEFQGELVSGYYTRPNFTDVSAVLKIIEMGGDFDDVRETLNIDISDERIKDFIRFDQENRARKEGSMKDGGLMDLGGKEMDLRGGGFVPIGKKERADDVPARLSKNEFVMTADAVRAAGGGSINKGAKRMYDLMNNLEARA